MLQNLNIKNFKRFEDQDLELQSPVIVLVGPNSSGKSSLIKVLLAFKQTFEDQGDHTGFLSRGEYVDVGPYSEYVRNHNEKLKCSFSFSLLPTRLRRRVFGLPQFRSARIQITHELDPQSGHGRLCDYTVYLPSQGENDEIPNVRTERHYSIAYKRMQKSEEAYRLAISKNLYDFVTDELTTNRLYSKRSSAPSFSEIRRTLSDGRLQAKRMTELGMTTTLKFPLNYEVLNFVHRLENSIVAQFHRALITDLTTNTFALAALRESPQRSSPRTDEKLVVGSRGQNTTSVYLDFRQRSVKAGKRHTKVQDDFRRLQSWIAELKLSNSLEVSSWRDLVDLRANTRTGQRKSDSIVDIGVGFSQAIPILVQLAVMPENTRLILEQPELHLYPWAQAEIGKILCDEAKRGNKQLIIETHSEHIIRGIQSHVSRSRPFGPHTAFTNEQVTILYVYSDGSVDRLRMDENGEFTKKWPSGFFDQGLSAFDEIIRNKELPDHES